MIYLDGELIPPGAWGRTVQGMGPSHAHYYREMVWEMVRRAEFADCPSRMKAAFAFEDLAHAMAFRRDRPGENVYAVTIEPGAITHRADMTWIDSALERRSFDDVAASIRRYWSGDVRFPSVVEIVIEGNLRVVRRITDHGAAPNE
jgi:hypothetical protein